MKNKKDSGWVKFKQLTKEEKRIVKAETRQLFEFNKYNLSFFLRIEVEKGVLRGFGK